MFEQCLRKDTLKSAATSGMTVSMCQQPRTCVSQLPGRLPWCHGLCCVTTCTYVPPPAPHVCPQTEMCRTWIETGGCRYGSRCQFAHGPQELRPVTRHPKYKTQPCRTFSVHGSCPYGDRCNFIHDVHPSAQSLADSSVGIGVGFEGLL